MTSQEATDEIMDRLHLPSGAAVSIRSRIEEEFGTREQAMERLTQVVPARSARWPRAWMMRPGDNGLLWRIRRANLSST